EVKAGDQAIWGFEFQTGEVCYGTASQLRDVLGPALERGLFDQFPLLRVEIAKFCDQRALYEQSLVAAHKSLTHSFAKSAWIWRNATILLPSVREDLAVSL